MAELIKRDDSLNDGRKKLNNAIEKVDTFQDQINTIVVDGDSSVEAAQARIDANNNTFPTLKARLDAKETQTSEQLAQTEQQNKEEFNRVRSNLNNVQNKFENEVNLDLTAYLIELNAVKSIINTNYANSISEGIATGLVK